MTYKTHKYNVYPIQGVDFTFEVVSSVKLENTSYEVLIVDRVSSTIYLSTIY